MRQPSAITTLCGTASSKSVENRMEMIVGQPFSFFFSFFSVSAPLTHFPSVPQPFRLKRRRNSVFFGNSHRGEKTRLYFFLISAQSTDAGVIRDGSGVNAAGILVSFTTVKRKKNPVLRWSTVTQFFCLKRVFTIFPTSEMFRF